MAKAQRATEPADGLRIEYMDLDSLKAAKRNPKRHALRKLDESVGRFGYTEPILLNEKTGRMVAGHGRREALLKRREAGEAPPAGVRVEGDAWLVPVVRGVSFKSEREAEAYLLASNRLVELGLWDDEELAAVLKDVDSFDGVGFDDDDYRRLLADLDPDKGKGKTPTEYLEGFQNAEIKQIVLLFPSEEYDAVVARLERIGRQVGLDSNTEVVLRLLDEYEARHPDAG